MSDLISRSKLIGELVSNSASAVATPREVKQQNKILQIVREQPTVEANSVVHGEWKFEMSTVFPVYRCSECNCATMLGQTKFCPNCGADMRKKVAADDK